MKNNFIKITKLSSGNLIIHHAKHSNFAKVHFLYLRKKYFFVHSQIFQAFKRGNVVIFPRKLQLIYFLRPLRLGNN